MKISRPSLSSFGFAEGQYSLNFALVVYYDVALRTEFLGCRCLICASARLSPDVMRENSPSKPAAIERPKFSFFIKFLRTVNNGVQLLTNMLYQHHADAREVACRNLAGLKSRLDENTGGLNGSMQHWLWSLLAGVKTQSFSRALI